MSGTISFNPYATSFPVNPFVLQTQGYISGFAVDEPASRGWLRSGVLASTETIVMWGGVPVSQAINQNGNGSEQLGPQIKRATSASTTLGFSVFNQAAHMVLVPGATSVPTAATGNSVHFYRIGSGQVRIVVACDPALVSALTAGELTNGVATLYWNTTSMFLSASATNAWALPSTIQLESVSTNSKVVSWNGTVASWSQPGDAAVIII